jgi:mannose-6-phosphate isomerase-like protein (cupin superfamily)
MELIKSGNRQEWSEISGSRQAFAKDMVTSEFWKAMSLHFCRIEPGGFIATHGHKIEDEVHFIISGHGIAVIGDERKPVESYDVILAPAGLLHGIENTGNENMLLVCAFNPPLV